MGSNISVTEPPPNPSLTHKTPLSLRMRFGSKGGGRSRYVQIQCVLLYTCNSNILTDVRVYTLIYTFFLLQKYKGENFKSRT